MNQELAIFSYENHQGNKDFWRIYSQENIEHEGVEKYLMNRSVLFKTKEDIISDLEKVIKEWLQIWKPTESIIRFETPNLEIGNRSSGKLSGIHIDLQIENLASEPIKNFILGIIISEKLHLEEPTGRKMQIRGNFKNYFDSNKNIVHHIIPGELLGSFVFLKKFQLTWTNNPQFHDFQIGFYVRGDNLDLTPYYTMRNKFKPQQNKMPVSF